MRWNMRTLVVVVLMGASLLLAACGGGGATAPAGGGSNSGGASAGGATTIAIGSDGENLAFDETALTVSAGQEVTINFQNNSAAQQHNWVLVNGGEDVAAPIATAGLTAGADANFLPAGDANVLTATPLANGGETTSVTFTAPAAGTYLFICTVPGHYPLMQGTLTVN